MTVVGDEGVVGSDPVTRTDKPSGLPAPRPIGSMAFCQKRPCRSDFGALGCPSSPGSSFKRERPADDRSATSFEPSAAHPSSATGLPPRSRAGSAACPPRFASRSCRTSGRSTRGGGGPPSSRRPRPSRTEHDHEHRGDSGCPTVFRSANPHPGRSAISTDHHGRPSIPGGGGTLTVPMSTAAPSGRPTSSAGNGPGTPTSVWSEMMLRRYTRTTTSRGRRVLSMPATKIPIATRIYDVSVTIE